MTPEEKKKVKKHIAQNLDEMLMGIRIGKFVMETEDKAYGDLFLEVLQEELEKLRDKPAFPEGVRRAMLSQPMAGKTDGEIIETRERAIKALQEKGYFVVNTLFTDEWYSREAMASRGVAQIPLCFLAKSLECMSLCHAAYFCKGWEETRGCRIEHAAAVAYGLDILYEE